jgi:hypothetical protein
MEDASPVKSHRPWTTAPAPPPAPLPPPTGHTSVTEVLEQLLLVGRRAGAEVTIDVRQGAAIRGELRRQDEQVLLQLASRAVRDLGGRRRRATPTIEVRLGHRTLELATVDRAAIADVLRVPVQDPAIGLAG